MGTPQVNFDKTNTTVDKLQTGMATKDQMIADFMNCMSIQEKLNQASSEVNHLRSQLEKMDNEEEIQYLSCSVIMRKTSVSTLIAMGMDFR